MIKIIKIAIIYCVHSYRQYAISFSCLAKLTFIFLLFSKLFIIERLLCAKGYLRCWGFDSEQNTPIALTFIELLFQRRDKDNVQSKNINDILGWRMMNATEEKKAEEGLGNNRLLKDHTFKRDGQRRPHRDYDT